MRFWATTANQNMLTLLLENIHQTHISSITGACFMCSKNEIPVFQHPIPNGQLECDQFSRVPSKSTITAFGIMKFSFKWGNSPAVFILAGNERKSGHIAILGQYGVPLITLFNTRYTPECAMINGQSCSLKIVFSVLIHGLQSHAKIRHWAGVIS